jgi:hypothetical protein
MAITMESMISILHIATTLRNDCWISYTLIEKLHVMIVPRSYKLACKTSILSLLSNNRIVEEGTL